MSGVTSSCGLNNDATSNTRRKVRYVTLERAYDPASFKWVICHLGIFGEPVDQVQENPDKPAEDNATDMHDQDGQADAETTDENSTDEEPEGISILLPGFGGLNGKGIMPWEKDFEMF